MPRNPKNPAAQLEAMRQFRKRNPSYYSPFTKRRRDVLTAYALAYRLAHPCIRCGEADPVCLDFHHRDPQTKDINISRARKSGWSIARFAAEIAKCDVLCANCHRKVHATERL